jgi:hypothetical protein
MSSTTLWFGTLSPRSIKHRPLSPNTWTCVGALAIPLWATWPSLAIHTRGIPPFESLAIMFFFGWPISGHGIRNTPLQRAPLGITGRGIADLESLGWRRCDCASRPPFAYRTLDSGLTGDVYSL